MKAKQSSEFLSRIFTGTRPRPIKTRAGRKHGLRHWNQRQGGCYDHSCRFPTPSPGFCQRNKHKHSPCRNPARHKLQNGSQCNSGIIAARQTGVETEQPCPYCKRVHYSSYTAVRCAARHDVASYENGKKEKRQKQKPLQTGMEGDSTLIKQEVISN